MNRCTCNNPTSVELLAALVVQCKRDGLVRQLAKSLDVKRQTVYLWTNIGDKGLTSRAAKLRLLEISSVDEFGLRDIALMASQALARLVQLNKTTNGVNDDNSHS